MQRAVVLRHQPAFDVQPLTLPCGLQVCGWHAWREPNAARSHYAGECQQLAHASACEPGSIELFLCTFCLLLLQRKPYASQSEMMGVHVCRASRVLYSSTLLWCLYAQSSSLQSIVLCGLGSCFDQWAGARCQKKWPGARCGLPGLHPCR